MVTCGGQCTRDTTLKQIHDMVTRRYVLSVDNDNDIMIFVKKKILGVV
jgi:hypothetical protein